MRKKHKKIMWGILLVVTAIALIAFGITKFGFLEEEVIIEGDSFLDTVNIQQDFQQFANGGFLFSIGSEGDEEIKIDLFSTAVHAIFGDSWVILKKYSLPLELKSEVDYSSEYKSVEAATYNDIYLYMPSVTIIKDDKEHTAIMPSNRLHIEGHFIQINADENTLTKVIILKDESIFQTSTGEYVFAPKIRVLSYANTLEDGSNGTLWTDVIVGMDIDGQIRAGFGIDTSKEIVLNSEGNLEYKS